MIYRQTILAVERHLTDQPQTARVIWRRAGCWAPESVRGALGEMVAAGLAVRGTEPWHGHHRVTFRRPA